MGECFEQRRVRLGDLISAGEYEGQFARRAGESRSGMRTRLLAQEGIQDGGNGKTAAYERGLARGDAFPPVFVFALGDELILDDGWHRCAAAALRGQKTISAVVFRVRTSAGADGLSILLYDLEDSGLRWQDRARFGGFWLKQKAKADAATG